VRLLLDTHLLLWSATGSDRLTKSALELLEDERAELLFRAANIWEVAVKASLGRRDFEFNPAVLRRALIENGYVEIPISGVHASPIADLPPIHRDPFGRILIKQAAEEDATLLTVDKTIAKYPGAIRLVGNNINNLALFKVPGN